jgi:Tol biopolymer transport system component
MHLEPGQTLLHYRVVEKIGEGGMGEVWKAIDTSLDREVAIKILPEALAADQERLARFEREAKLLASLNHPNIAAVYGLHEAASSRFIAMELVTGEDLAVRLRREPLDVDDALTIARQIAEGCAAAHDQGVIHRDLKTANVVMSSDGKIKILDFGLAKAFGPDQASGPTSLSLSPTMTSAGTVAGTLLGTAAYMSPEQARGKPVDKRADVWAFGCVLYEMLTGKQAFAGETITDVLAAIVHREPDWKLLPERTPPGVVRLMKRCVRKDLEQRVRDMGDLGVLLQDARAGFDSGETPRAATESPRRRRLWPAVAGLLAVALIVSLTTRRTAPGGDTGSNRAAVGGMTQLTDLPGVQESPSLSPDGKQLIYVSEVNGQKDIFLQRVGGENAVNLTGDFADDDFHPTFAPDGERIAFCSRREGGGIYVMGATGESPRKVSDEGFHPAWSPDGRKLAYTTERVTDPTSRAAPAALWVVDVESLEKTKLSDGDASGVSWSPNGKRIAYWSYWYEVQGQRDILTLPTEGGTPVPVTNDAPTDWDPVWSPDGRWLYFLSDRGGSPDLWRVPIDESSGETRGAPEPVTTGIARIMQADFAGDGKRLAVTAQRASGEVLRIPFDPARAAVTGTAETIHSSSNPLTQTAVSNDGQWLAYRTTAPREQIWVMRLDGTGRRRLIDDEYRNRGPSWSPDDRWLGFYSNRSGSYEFWAVRPDGTGLKQMTDTPEDDLTHVVWSPDGRRLIGTLFNDGWGGGMIEFGERGIDGLDEPAAMMAVPGTEGFNTSLWSPDGRHLYGFAADAQDEFVAALYSLETESYELLSYPDGRPVRSYVHSDAWLDERRVALWDDELHRVMVLHIDGSAAHTVEGVPGPAGVGFADGGRTLVVNRTTEESEIWLLELGDVSRTGDSGTP